MLLQRYKDYKTKVEIDKVVQTVKHARICPRNMKEQNCCRQNSLRVQTETEKAPDLYLNHEMMK